MVKKIVKGVKKKVRASDPKIVKLVTRIATAINVEAKVKRYGREASPKIGDLCAKLGSDLNFDGKELIKAMKSIKKQLKGDSQFVRDYRFALNEQIDEIRKMGWW